MDDSPLRKLPPELLNCIWEMALLHTTVRYPPLRTHGRVYSRPVEPLPPTHPMPITLCRNGRPPKRGRGWYLDRPESRRLYRLLALTSTCKEIRSATSEMFFHINTFEIVQCLDRPRGAPEPTPVQILNRFRTWLTRGQAAAINKVVILYPLNYADGLTKEFRGERRKPRKTRFQIVIEHGLKEGKKIADVVPDTKISFGLLGKPWEHQRTLIHGVVSISMTDVRSSWEAALLVLERWRVAHLAESVFGVVLEDVNRPWGHVLDAVSKKHEHRLSLSYIYRKTVEDDMWLRKAHADRTLYLELKAAGERRGWKVLAS